MCWTAFVVKIQDKYGYIPSIHSFVGFSIELRSNIQTLITFLRDAIMCSSMTVLHDSVWSPQPVNV